MRNKILTFIAIILFAFLALIALFRFAEETRAAVNLENLPDFQNQASLNVTKVQPNTAPNDVDTPIVIQGTGFTATISGTEVITVPSVYLGNHELIDVLWSSTTTLSATLPWGLEPNIYSLTVVNPDGISGTLSSAFTVTEGLGNWISEGPYGGVIYDLHVNPLNPQHVYAVLDHVGLFISQDSGEHWNLALFNEALENVTFDASNENVITVGGGGWVYQSQDGGQSWHLLVGREAGNTVLHHCYIHTPVAHPADSGVFYDGLEKCQDSTVLPDLSGVYRVEDDGTTWITITNNLTDTNVTALAVHPDDANKLLAGTFSGNIFYSSDGGNHWTWKYSTGNYSIRELYFDPYSTDAWALYVDSRYPNQSEANSWMAVSSDIGYSTWTTRTIAGNTWEIGALDFTPGKVWAGGGNLYVSTDQGLNWDRVTDRSEPGRIPDTSIFTINPADPQIIYGDGYIDGIYKSIDGGKFWTPANAGLAGLAPFSLVLYPGNPDILYARAAGAGLLWTRNGGESWGVTNFWNGGFPGPALMAVDPMTSTRLYMGDATQINRVPGVGVADWVDGEWQTIYTSTFPLDPAEQCGTTTALATHPTLAGRLIAGAITYPCDDIPDDFFAGTGHIFLSTDHGHTWNDVSPAGTFGWTTEFAIGPKDPNRVYGVNFDGVVLRSNNAGASWQILSVGELSQTHGGDIVIHPNDPDTVFAYYSAFEGSTLYRSTDGGQTWKVVHDNGGQYAIIAPPIPDAFGYTLYIGCHFSEQLCRSVDNGKTWQVVSGVPSPTALAVGLKDQRVRIYIGSPGGIASTGAQSANNILLGDEIVPGLNGTISGGVYRLTTLLPDHWVYLPLIRR
jgi:photosystem II stability/assembly factor-like uncharacterized protein